MSHVSDGAAAMFYVANFIEVRRNATPKATYDAIAIELGCSKAHAIGIHQLKKGIGQELETRLAEKFAGGSINKFREQALAWAKANPGWVSSAYKPAVDVETPAQAKWSAHERWTATASAAKDHDPSLGWAIEAAGDLPQFMIPTELTVAFILRLAEVVVAANPPEKARRKWSRADAVERASAADARELKLQLKRSPQLPESRDSRPGRK